MQTFDIGAAPPSDSVIRKLAELLRAGEVLILPTDTIYGLHGDALSESAVGQIFAMKERERGKPLVVLAASITQIEGFGAILSPEVRAFLENAWPAPLTAVLALQTPIPASAGASTIAVRIPALDWMRRLIERTGPLTSTSVNVSGEPPVTRFEDIPGTIRAAVAAGVDSGTLQGAPSTLLDLTGSSPRLIREGAFRFSQDLWKSPRKSL